MLPEQQARLIIDEKLAAAGWIVQDRDHLDLSVRTGIAVREFLLKPGHGKVDYLLYANRKVIGVVEAKPAGTTLTGVEPQSARYAEGLPDELPAYRRPLPFLYESTGDETHFTNGLDPEPRARDIFHFHAPEALAELVAADAQLRQRLCTMPPLNTDGLWRAQIQAITNLEKSLSHGRQRALIQMATGSGKTFTSANFIYRLIKYANAKRILFLVDRDNLGRQCYREFSQFCPPDDGRRFSDIYNIQHLHTNSIDKVSRVCISTVQRMFSMLKGEEDYEVANEQGSMFDSSQPLSGDPLPIGYNPRIPIDTFDFIVVDECHRSIYNLWRQVLEYFDAFIIGLTATPAKQTIGYFDRNLVMEYPHAQAVADGVNVNYDVFRIRTRITEGGSTVEAENYVDIRDRVTRKVRYEQLDDDLTYSSQHLDRDVVAVDQIRTVIRAFKQSLPTIFQGRTEVPKTLIFAKDDSHAEDIVNIVREEFGKGNDFCQKITYRTGFMKQPKTVIDEDGNEQTEYHWEKLSSLTPEEVLTTFRNSFNPRVAVTVDMVATGTDVKPLEIVMFMRNVKSANFFEQMKGRGVRVASPDELKAVTPDATFKTRFVIIDAVGVCEHDKTETSSLNRQPTVSLKKVLASVAAGDTREDTLSTLASRLTRLTRELDDDQKAELAGLVGGKSLEDIAGDLVRSIEPDTHELAARDAHGLTADDVPTPLQFKAAADRLKQDAVEPFVKAAFRQRLLEIKQQTEQTIDRVSLDEVLDAGFDEAALERAQGQIDGFRTWIEENRDEITALQLIYSKRYGNRISFADVKELATRIARPPVNATPEELWRAYEALEQSQKREGGKQLVDLVSIIRHTVDPDEPLTPFGEVVIERFEQWLAEQDAGGAEFTDEHRQWLRKIAEHIATSVVMERGDFESGWFGQQGSLGRAYTLFGDELDTLLTELNEELVA